MTIYPSGPLPTLSNVPLNQKNTKSSTVKSTPVKHWPILNDESPQTADSLPTKLLSPQTDPQSKPAPCKKQCQFCSHFQLELTHWGHCSALSTLVPGQATACILHEPYFSERKTAVSLAQLQRPPLKEDSLKVLRTNAYYHYPSTDCQA